MCRCKTRYAIVYQMLFLSVAVFAFTWLNTSLNYQSTNSSVVNISSTSPLLFGTQTDFSAGQCVQPYYLTYNFYICQNLSVSSTVKYPSVLPNVSFATVQVVSGALMNSSY